jgi:AcrR family transcriptional regulator
MPASPSQVRAETTPRRERILDETLRIVGERGYHGFGIQELAERCGLTKPGLLHHFGSKDQLLIALLHDRDEKHEAELGQLLLPAFDAAASPQVQRDMFRQALRAVAERSLAQPELVRLQVVLRAEAINPDHPAHDYFVAREEATLGRLAMRAASFSAHPQSTARQILAMMSGLQEQWLREDMRFDYLAEWDRGLKVLLP